MRLPVHLYMKFTTHKKSYKNYVQKITINVSQIKLTSQTPRLFSHIPWQTENWLLVLCTQHSHGTLLSDLPLTTASRWKRGGDKTSVKYRR